MKKTLTLIIVTILLISVSGCKKENQVCESYQIDAIVNQDMTVDCAMTYTFYNHYQNDLEKVLFSLYPKAFSESATVKPIYDSDYENAYVDGVSYGDIEIKCIKSSGKDLPFSVGGINNGTLTVNFNEKLKINKTASIYMEFTVKLPSIRHRFGYGNNTINLSGFYPIACVYENGKFYENVYYPSGDPFYSNTANYQVNLTVPSEYTLASSMHVTKTVWSGGETEYQMQRNSVRDIAFILSKNFNVLQKTVNGVDVKYYYYNDNEPSRSLEIACESLSYFSNNYVKYPYLEYVVCQGDFLYGGMEYPCLSLISDELNDENKVYTVVHETAHQWFYGLVGVNQSEEGFFDEGLTELSTTLCLSDLKPKEYNFQEMISQTEKLYDLLKSTLEAQGYKNVGKLKRNLGDFNNQTDYVITAYYRSQIMFSKVLNAMGKKKFIGFLKDFTNKYSHKNVNSTHFVSFLSRRNKSAVNTMKEFLS